jgi:hypothetical protein
VHHSAIAMLMTAIIVGLVVVAAAAQTLAMTVIRGPCARWWTDHQPRHEQWLARSARELGTSPLMVTATAASQLDALIGSEGGRGMTERTTEKTKMAADSSCLKLVNSPPRIG